MTRAQDVQTQASCTTRAARLDRKGYVKKGTGVATPALKLAALAAIVSLAGCAGGGGLFGRSAEDNDLPPAKPSIQVMSKGFTIAGPRGFCIDEGATQETSDGAFVILGSCAVISGNPADHKPRRPALLTASVTPATEPLDAAALDRMTAFFSTEAGLAALARTDSVATAQVLDLDRGRDMVLVHAQDGATAGDVQGDYWRAVFETGGQLVTITVSGFRETPLDPRDGARLARDFAAAIRKANPEPNGTPAAADGGGLASFFNRLL